MTLTPIWLDELRARTTLSALIGQSITVTRAGREWKACCPFHNEKTPSFTINDDKGFGHCFGCGWHGDAIRWLTDSQGLSFIDAVQQLALAAGMDMPRRSAAAEMKTARIVGIRPALELAAAYYAARLSENAAARDYLNERGFDEVACLAFGLGWAPDGWRHISTMPGMTRGGALDAGLLWAGDGKEGPTFRSRVMVPVHDARGKIVGFAGRDLSGGEGVPKYKNSPASDIFDKGRLLFNAHRAAARLGAARAGGNRAAPLLIVEGQFDALQCEMAGMAAVAPMGTALTADQMTRAWRMHACPTVIMDGDAAGQKAAVRAAEMLLPLIVPGQSVRFARCGAGDDPDTIIRRDGAAALTAVIDGAVTLSRLLFDAAAAGCEDRASPESVAGVWSRCEAWLSVIVHDELRAQFHAEWRGRFDREVSLAAALVAPEPASDYVWDGAPEAVPEAAALDDDAAVKLRVIVDKMVRLRAEKADFVAPINADLRDCLLIAKALGFVPREVNAAIRAIEADAAARIEAEAIQASYRHALGISGPMAAAILPAIAGDARARAGAVMDKRARRLDAMLDMPPARMISHGYG